MARRKARRFTLETLDPRAVLAGDLLISEFMAFNTNDPGNLLDADGDSSDWIEIYNPTESAVDLDGWHLTDTAGDLDLWTFPPRTLGPNSHLIVFASNKDRTGPELHTSFELNGLGEYLALVRPDLSIAHEFAPTFPEQLNDVSYGVVDAPASVNTLVGAASTAEALIPTAAEAGATWTATDFDSSGWASSGRGMSGPQGLGFELAATAFNSLVDIGAIGGRLESGADGGGEVGAGAHNSTGNLSPTGITAATSQNYSIAIDNLNAAGAAVGTIEWRDRGDSTNGGQSLVQLAEDHVKNESGIIRVTLTGLPAGSYSVTSYHVDADNSTCGAIRISTSSSGGYVDAGVVGNSSFTGTRNENSWTTALVQLQSATFVVTSDGVNPVRILFDGTAAAAIEVPLSGLRIDNGASGVFGPSIGTDLEAVQYAQNASAWVRLPFSYGGGAAIDQMTLRMKYDAGFVAYLNGTEIARRNALGAAGSPVAFDATATAGRTDAEALAFESIDVTASAGLLFTNDTNVLAIHGLNESATDDDFLLSAELTAASVEEGVRQYFTTATPGAANIPGTIGFVADTKFSVDRGFFTAPFTVEITSETAGAEIRYTTDGSEPTATTGTVYSGPITINRTTALRAAAFKPGLTSTNVDTHTYFFLDQVLTQTGTGLPPYAPWGCDGCLGTNAADWDVDPDIVTHAVASNRLTTDDLKSVPTISLVTNWNDMFGTGGRGIYIAGFGREVPASVEMINPDGTTRFAITASTEIQGGTSDDRWKDDKLSQELKFKAPYGPTKLNADIFGTGATDSFDRLMLDGVLNWSWVHARDAGQRAGAKYIQDQFVADLQNATGGFAPHGIFTHLYINGLYWGMYYLHERPDNTFQSDYQGGDKDEWNVMKHRTTTIVDNATNNPAGVTAATDYNSMVALANADLSIDANYQALAAKLDIENFINYVLVNWYAGNDDWPHQNWYASRRQSPDGKWRFHSWDAEHVLKNVNYNPITSNPNGPTLNSPSGLHERLKLNAGYRVKFADQVHKLLVQPGGVLTRPVATAMYQARMAEVDRAIVGESARWGDNSEAVAKTRADWMNTQNNLLTNYFPQRTSNMLSYLRAAGLYPSIDAPAYSQQGGEVADGYSLSVSDPNNPTGTIYYTTDGSDPFQPVTTVGTTLLPERSAVCVKVPTVADESDIVSWRTATECGAGWTSGNAGVGFDAGTAGTDYTPHIGVNVQQEMLNVNTSVWVRSTFEVADPGLIATLALQTQLDDGYVAFLNGFEVHRQRAPATLAWNAAATAGTLDPAAVNFTNFDISAHVGRLVAGTNVLAIHALNRALTDNDLLISPRVVGTTTSGTGISPTAQQYTGPVVFHDTSTIKSRVRRAGAWSALTEAFFTVDEPVRVAELYYNPPGNSESTEFIELVNTSGAAVDLTGFKFVRDESGVGIDYEFLASDTNRTIPAGGRMVLVQDRAAFMAAYPWVPMTAIADRVYSGNLDNAGETITLFDAGGGVLQRFTYDDVWYDATDGDGYSLVVPNVTVGKTAWSVPQGWQPSRELGGSPGETDVLRGDFNGDSRVDGLDLAILQANLGTVSGATHAVGDMSRDGAVGRDDVALFLANFADTYSPPVVPSPAAVPGAVVARRNGREPALAAWGARRITTLVGPISPAPVEDRAGIETSSRVLRARRIARSPAVQNAQDAAITSLFGEQA
jgi:hypothetical protein